MIKYVVLINTNIQPNFCKKIKDIHYKMTEDFICFSFEMRTKMKTYLLSCSSQNIVKLLKSFLTLYLLRYSRPLKLKSMIIKENNEIVANHIYDETNPFSLYGIIEHKFEKKLPKLYKNNFIVERLFEKESNSFRTVINYYLIGMSKRYENDRFYYLFSCLNSLVNLLVPGVKRDNIKFSYFFKNNFKCQHDLVGETKSKKLLTLLENFLYKKPNLSFDDLISNINVLEDEYVNYIDEKNTKSEASEFFKYQFIYYLRCNIVHGEKTSVLYTLRKDINFILLQYSNYVITKLIEDILMSEEIQKYVRSAAILE